MGRSAACYIQITEGYASGEHAVIQWNGSHWAVRDLGSRNGTFVAGERLETGKSAPLRVGAQVAFGDLAQTWVLQSDAPPQPIGIELHSRQVVGAAEELLALPNEAEPEASIYRGDDGRWICEQGSEQSEVMDQQIVKLGEQSWCLLLPEVLDATPLVEADLSLESLRFRFAVSQNEEHVQLTLLQGEREVALEPREFHYTLLVLARLRMEDREQTPSERGWVSKEELLKMLAMRSTALNVAIHRARQQLLQARVLGAPKVVEVRRGERRFGSDRIEVVPL